MKNFSISILVAGVLFSGMASAIQLSTSGRVPITTCGNLREDVNINLTTGVVAGVSCTTARVAIAACHTAGMLKSRSVGRKTINVDVDDGAGNITPTPTVVSCTVGTADPACTSTPVEGAAVASATSNRGTVNTEYPGTGACLNAGVPEAVANGLP